MAKLNSGVRPQVHFTSYSLYAKPQLGIYEIKAQQFYNALKWDSALLAGVSAWNTTHYLISGGVWPLGQGKMAKANLSGTTRLWKDICGDFYQVAWWKLWPPLLIVWEVFFYRYASKEICLSASCMSSLCWNNMLLLSLVVVVFVCRRWSFRVSERWNWLRKDSGLNSLRGLCCYGQSSSSCCCAWCYLVNVLVPACLLPTFLTLRHSWDQQRSMYWNSDFH